MAGKGRAPKPETARRRAAAPTRGEWRTAPGVGWQHGAVPKPPEGLAPASVTAWRTWMGSWWAAYWDRADLPVLSLLIRVYDLAERGQANGAMRAELRQLMDSYGITPKGRQDRRWLPPASLVAAAPVSQQTPAGPYAHLRVVEPEGDAS